MQQALAKNCVDLLAALPGESRISLFQQMSSVIAESGCAWRIRLALADQLGTIALLFDIKVRSCSSLISAQKGVLASIACSPHTLLRLLTDSAEGSP